VLEILREHSATRPFSLRASSRAAPISGAEIVAAGHRVELHCYRHRNLLRLTTAEFLDDAEARPCHDRGGE